MFTEELVITEKENFIEKHKKAAIGIIIFLSLLIVVYLGSSVYFMNHFYYGSVVNAMNVSGKTVEEVKGQMLAELQTYTLNLRGRDGFNEQITAADIGLKYSSAEEVDNLKNKQKPLGWITAFSNTGDYDITIGVSYDEQLLKDKLDKLSCFDSNNIIEPENPAFVYSDNGYMIVKEILGNKVNRDILYNCVVNAILNKETIIDLEAANCYINPKYSSNSPEVIDIKNKLDKYVSAKITYVIGEKTEILDGSTINKWLAVDDNLILTFSEEKVKEYVDGLSSKYNTVGRSRKFNTSSGQTINISRGDYGWLINRAKETQDLIVAIKEGQNITKQPACIQTAQAHGFNDIGNTYVEINLTKQHLWFYKNGSLVVDGDVVTGNIRTNNATPSGVYRLKYKERNAVLKGEDYEVNVAYWMPFNGGIGLHDAAWRSKFGGTIYKTDGSHGCINCPYSLAKTIYDNISPGIPVVCYN